MYYSPANQYLWDFWMIKYKKHYHLFHLQAPRNLPSPNDRHEFASIGHAVSSNLYHWTDAGIALEKGPKGSWDDTSLWTGSTIKKGDIFYMFYTSRSSTENRKIQRVGVAFSKDLKHWKKYKNNPIIEADSQWYETSQISKDGQEHWRDPFVIYHSSEKFYYAFICARVNFGESNSRGCIGRAISKDLLHWKVINPATIPGKFMQMEVPDVHSHKDNFYLIFSTANLWYSKEKCKEIYPEKPQTGAHYYCSKDLSDIFLPIPHHEVLLGTETYSYGTRIFKNFSNEMVCLSWKEKLKEMSDFAGFLDYPKKINYSDDGSLTIAS